MKPFDLEAAKRGDAVCTRDGRKVRIVCFNVKNASYPLIVLIEDYDGDEEYHNTYTTEGRSLIGRHDDDDDDLMMVPNTKKLWIAVSKNIYSPDDIAYHITSSAYKDLEILKKMLVNSEMEFIFKEIEIEVCK